MQKQGFFCFVCFLVMSIMSAGCSDNTVDGSSEEGSASREKVITAIVEEMTEGIMARNAFALEEKVFPHISENYEHAGFDKNAHMQDLLEDLEENPDLHISGYEMTTEVTITNVKSATVKTTNAVTGTIDPQEGIDFQSNITGIFNGLSYMVLEDDGKWRTIGGDARFSKWDLNGGDEAYKMELDGVTVDIETLAPDGTVRISGSVELSEISGTESITADLSLDWKDDRYNAKNWGGESDSNYQFDLTDKTGTSYSFDVNMPGDGQPQGLKVPSALPVGIDGIDVNVTIFVSSGADDFEPIRVERLTFSLPFLPLANEECPEKVSTDPDGLWTMNLVHEYDNNFKIFQIADLRLVNNDIYGSILYATKDDENKDFAAALEIAGGITGDQIAFDFTHDNFSVNYQATLDGKEMTGGEAVFNIDGSDYLFFFTGRKLDNRCEGIGIGELDGESLIVSIGETYTAYTLSADSPEVVLTAQDATFSGYLLRNALVAIDDAAQGRWLMLGFYNQKSGYAALMESGDLLEGSFANGSE